MISGKRTGPILLEMSTVKAMSTQRGHGAITKIIKVKSHPEYERNFEKKRRNMSTHRGHGVVTNQKIILSL